MSAARIVLRRQWRSDHPPVFGRTPAKIGARTRRRTFREWLAKHFGGKS